MPIRPVICRPPDSLSPHFLAVRGNFAFPNNTMAKLSFEEKRARLKKLAEEPASDDAAREIRQALSGANSVLAAKAAAVAAKLGLWNLAPDLISAFNRYLQDPVRSDPGCRAKIAAIEALNALDGSEAYEKGIGRDLSHS
jgi:hypothetical protein